MDEIGSVLYEARLSKGMSLNTVQEKLKIQQKYLLAMEEGRFDALPTQTHARGYLRNYAKLLDIDAQPLLDSHQAQMANPAHQKSAKPNGQVDLPPGSPFFDPVNMKINPMRSGNSDSIFRLIIIVALIAAILLIGSRFFTNSEAKPSFSLGEFYDTVIRGETPATVAEIDTAEIVRVNEVEPENPLPIETSRNAVGDGSQPATLVPIFTCPSAELFKLRIDATERVWLEMYVDGVKQEADNLPNLPRGSTLEYTVNENFRINTGNAYALVLTINNDPLGRLGQPQGVVDLTCETSS